MIRKCPELVSVPPFKWLYDDCIRTEFEEIVTRISGTQETRVEINLEQQIERREVLVTLEQVVQSQTSLFLKDLSKIPEKVANEVFNKISPVLEKSRTDQAQMLVNQASAILGPSYDVNITRMSAGTDEDLAASECDNVTMSDMEQKIEFDDIWINKKSEVNLYEMMVKEWESKTASIQILNPRTNKMEYSWGGHTYSSAQKEIRKKFGTVYRKVVGNNDVQNQSKTASSKAIELDSWWNIIARENKIRAGKLSDMTHAYKSNMTEAEFSLALLARRRYAKEKRLNSKKSASQAT